jgi:hypothetical protein
LRHPAPDEALQIKQAAIGLNFLDTYYPHRPLRGPELACRSSPASRGCRHDHRARRGRRRILPSATASPTATADGAYAQERNVAPKQAGEGAGRHIRSKLAAAMMLKGMTAQYLLRPAPIQVKPVTPLLLFHAAAGGVGLIPRPVGEGILAPTVRSAPRARRRRSSLALAHGYDHVIDYRAGRTSSPRVRALTGGAGVRRRLRFRRQGHVSEVARLPAAARHVRQLRQLLRSRFDAFNLSASWRRRARSTRRGRRSSPTPRRAMHSMHVQTRSLILCKATKCVSILIRLIRCPRQDGRTRIWKQEKRVERRCSFPDTTRMGGKG